VAKISCALAMNQALSEEMERDPNVVHMGIDVARAGGVFGTSRGLLDRFGGARVLDTPISEAAIVSIAVGASLVGMRPVVQLMFGDFLPRAWDEIVNQAAKIRYMFGGVSVPITIMASTGGGLSAAGQHSQSFEAMCAHIPGLKVICPSTPADCKGLLKAAIRDNNPVIYLDSKALLNIRGEVPDHDYIVPIGTAAIRREGTELTIVAVSRMVPMCVAAAESLEAEGISAEVIDLRSIYPMDNQTIDKSVRKTGRLLTVHEAPIFAGIGAEIIASVVAKNYGYLRAAPVRLGAPHTPTPFSRALEARHFPSEQSIGKVAKQIVSGRSAVA
jgi:pyruvate/2-oxoglutarate/acetoin dehydrogenase E1 component